jgi:dihydropteroate synthase/2-amino-4-hydroxy-6-hydroxymethyldihydropteridine diphosphokinase
MPVMSGGYMAREDFAIWRCGTHELSLARPRIMGVLEVGARGMTAEEAIARGRDMLDEGADLLDICGDLPAQGAATQEAAGSTTLQEEAEFVVPVVRGLAGMGAIVCVSTRHAEVAKMCVRLGASIINDPEGFTSEEMVQVVAGSDCGCIILCDSEFRVNASRRSVVLDQTHTPLRPVASNRRFTLPEEAPIMREIMGFLGDQARLLMRAGVSRDRICIDPGPGLNKTTDEDVVLQRNARKLVSMGYPLLQAVSRRGFSRVVAGGGTAGAATAGLSVWGVQMGARILRVHDVGQVSEAINAYWAMSKADPRQGFVSLGSNVGDRLGYLSRAVRRIDQIPMTCVVAVSSAYETEPAYGIATPVANAVAEIRSELHPLVLLGHLLDIERALDRIREPKEAGHGPRTIDCDLMWVEGEAHTGMRLTLPHPHMGERDYVLVPMEDLMHDPVRFFTHVGVPVAPPEQRVGRVISELGQLDWK